MKNFNIIFWLLGIGLIVLVCVLLSDYFSDLRILLLDGGVLMCVYSLFIYVYGGLYYDSDEFARDVPAVGVRIPALWLYATLALLGVVGGFAAAVSFSWQTLYQMCFLLLMIAGLLLGKASTERLHQVANNSQRLQQSKESLVSAAQQLRISAVTNTELDSNLKTGINKLSERIGYISPSTTAAAKELEDSLKISIERLRDLLNSGETQEVFAAELEKAQTVLSQRLITY